ncbi:urease accessory protein UreD [Roseomonas sp. CECT 9278]|uniref:urease accessory protein UreD n=1 Tax=Roseomonas sp. CECT 9278 TaxID=2845823 RepID=UPI001E3E9869|nr:urease accessory protein UreD [Roseomonas sp. CECT 9278]CAH0155597.1 Urease accessory protein UreD [Roseomonas sp. CECT 9278]
MSPSQAGPSHQRARGGAELHLSRSGAATRIAHLFQAAPARILFPTSEGDEPPLAVLVNTAGGLAGGDALALDLRLGAGAAATLSTPSAEKIYRSLGAATRIDATIDVGSGATLEWLPQETILFDGARLHRRIAVALAPDARLLFAEMMVFGRRARGEVMRDGAVQESWRLRRGGSLVWADGLALGGDLSTRLDDRFGFAGAEAMACLLLAVPGPVEPLRAALREADVAATMLRPGLLLARWLGDAAAVRGALGEAVRLVRVQALGLPARLPRLWTS